MLENKASFPLPTFTVNLLGSILLGAFIGILSKDGMGPSNLLLFLGVGFCGGFTTFSTFSVEIFQLLRSGEIVWAILYGLLSLVLGMALAFTAFYLSRNI